MSLFADRVATIGAENAFKVGADIARAQAAGVDVVKFNLGEPDFDSAEHINQVGCQEINNGNSHYCDAQGLLPFRESIARHASGIRGVEFGADQVVVTTGGKPPIGYTMMAYVNAGDEVVYPSPGFPVYESWITFVGAKAVPLHLEESKEFSFTADDLAPLLSERTKVVIINSPSNPTGGVQSKESIANIAAVIREKCSEHVRIFSDEIYDQIIFDGLSHNSIVSEPGMADRTIVVSGHSKAFAMTGWRLGYAILPNAEEAAIFKNFNINIVSCVPPFVQMAGKEALDNPATAGVVSTMVAAFEERRNYVVEALNGIDGVSCAMPHGAFYAFPNIGPAIESMGVSAAYEALPDEQRSRTTPSTLAQMFLLYVHGVATMDRRSFGALGCEGKHYLRLSIATDMESLKKGIERMSQGLADRDGFATWIAKGENLW